MLRGGFLNLHFYINYTGKSRKCNILLSRTKIHPTINRIKTLSGKHEQKIILYKHMYSITQYVCIAISYTYILYYTYVLYILYLLYMLYNDTICIAISLHIYPFKNNTD
jgi:hypothetical protein